MGKISDETISTLVGRGFEVMHGREASDFLGELNLKLHYVKSYFDPYDGLPVTVLKIETSDAAQNYEGNMHSGALCVMFDHLSTMTAFSDPGWWEIKDDIEETHLAPRILDRVVLELGLSRNIKMHVQRPVKAGSTVYFATKLLENTPKASYFFSQMFSLDGILLASGHHDKVKLSKEVKPKL